MSTIIDSLPEIASVAPGSASARAGVQIGDLICAVNGVSPRDVLEWQTLTAQSVVELEILRGRRETRIVVDVGPGEQFGASVTSALFDRIHTCDNHCEFCFIYQLPKGMRKSLYLKDDDYRLSFLYGNFTTMTRFTEADFERVVDQRLSPLYVSIHATNAAKRAEMLRNQRGGMSLRWMSELMKNDIEIRGQIVLCPGVNDGEVLESTLLDLLEKFDRLAAIAIVPLGLSKHNTEARMRVQTPEESREVIAIVERWQEVFLRTLGRPMVYAADEFYLLAASDLPQAPIYGEFEMLEDGIGIGRKFIDDFFALPKESNSLTDTRSGAGGFFTSIDIQNPTSYTAHNPAADTSLRPVAVEITKRRPIRNTSSIGVLTGAYGAQIITPLVASLGEPRAFVHEVKNSFFGGNTAVSGLMTGADILETLAHLPNDRLYLIPDVCLNGNRFLDGVTLDEINTARCVDVIPTNGLALRQAIEGFSKRNSL